METVEFYGGVDEIGGNKIKVNVDSTSLMLDFGMSFSKNGMYFDNFVNPRKSNGIGRDRIHGNSHLTGQFVFGNQPAGEQQRVAGNIQENQTELGTISNLD